MKKLTKIILSTILGAASTMTTLSALASEIIVPNVESKVTIYDVKMDSETESMRINEGDTVNINGKVYINDLSVDGTIIIDSDGILKTSHVAFGLRSNVILKEGAKWIIGSSTDMSNVNSILIDHNAELIAKNAPDVLYCSDQYDLCYETPDLDLIIIKLGKKFNEEGKERLTVNGKILCDESVRLYGDVSFYHIGTAIRGLVCLNSRGEPHEILAPIADQILLGMTPEQIVNILKLKK